jgi:hypothetical protein
VVWFMIRNPTELLSVRCLHSVATATGLSVDFRLWGYGLVWADLVCFEFNLWHRKGQDLRAQTLVVQWLVTRMRASSREAGLI